MLAPTSSFIPRPDCAFEFRMYLSLAAVVVGVVVAVYEAVEELKQRQILQASVATSVLIGLSMAVIATFSAMTYLRNRAYVSEETIWRDIIARRPESVRPCISLSGFLFQQGKYDEAARYCEQALTHLPDFSKTGIEELNRRRNDPDVERLHREVSFYSRIHNNLGLALQQEGRLDEAIAHFKEAMRLIPDNVGPQVNLACIAFGRGQRDEAVAMLRRAVRLEPENVAARECLGNALMFMGDTSAAVKSYEAILAIEPDNVQMLSKVAWILATDTHDAVRNGARAVVLAERAAKAVNYESGAALDTLAAAYAEAGRFDDAVRTERKAAALAGLAGRAAVEERLELYSERKPYRDVEERPEWKQ
jgi:tetratricopeptide (TPR) repeat protein